MPSVNAQEQIDPTQWVDRYGDDLYRYALARLHRPELAEEAVQETFVSALRARDQYAGRGKERSWLLGILKRKVIDLFRAQSRLPLSQNDQDPADVVFDRHGNWQEAPTAFGAGAEAALEKKEFLAAFRRCLQALPASQAMAFSAREIEGEASRDICETMRISQANLWVLLHRARLGLMRCLRSQWLHAEEDSC